MSDGIKVNSNLVWSGSKYLRENAGVVRKSLIESAIIVTNAAVKNAPKDTGSLKASISPTINETNAFIGTALEYAPYQEFGTRFQKAQPFLIPALLLNVNKIISIFKKNNQRSKYVN